LDYTFLLPIRTPSEVGSRSTGYDEEGSLGMQYTDFISIMQWWTIPLRCIGRR